MCFVFGSHVSEADFWSVPGQIRSKPRGIDSVLAKFAKRDWMIDIVKTFGHVNKTKQWNLALVGSCEDTIGDRDQCGVCWMSRAGAVLAVGERRWLLDVMLGCRAPLGCIVSSACISVCIIYAMTGRCMSYWLLYGRINRLLWPAIKWLAYTAFHVSTVPTFTGTLQHSISCFDELYIAPMLILQPAGS